MTVISHIRQPDTLTASTEVKPRRLRLPYNALFLPEYVSTVILSVLISWFFVVNVNIGMRGWHVAFAAVGYGLLASCLLWTTWRHRVVYSDVLFRRDEDGHVRIRVGREWIDIEHLESLEETPGIFFGRATRVLHARNSFNGAFEVNQCLSGYDQLKSILNELRGIEVAQYAHLSEERWEKLSERWEKRHRIFPPAFTAIDVAGRLGFRVFCLLPVAVVDVSINVVLNVLLRDAGRDALMVYVAPLSLAVSAFIARYVYYYLFTSTRLNQRIG